MSEFTFQPVASPWILGLLLALAAAPLLLRPGFSGMTDMRQWALVGLRIAALLLLFVGLLRPTFIHTESRPQPATIAFLFDASRSQTLTDLSDGKARWEGQLETLRSIEPQLAALGEELTAKAYAFDNGAREVELREGRFQFPTGPEGTQTDHGAALDDLRRRERGQRLAAVFLLGDGAQAAYSTRIPPQQVAAELAAQETPLYTITFGQVRADRDVAVENLQDQFTVFVKNTLSIRAQVRSLGYANKDLPVRLIVTDIDGNSVHTEMTTVRPGPEDEGQPLDIEFLYTPQAPGQFQVTVAADLQPEELVAKNNQLTSYLTVYEGGLKVLYLESVLEWWEPKFLRRAIDASPDVQLDFVWIDRSQAERAQTRVRELIARSEYDVYILGDVHASLLGAEVLQKIADAVDRGKGLLMLGGYYNFDPGGYTGTPLDGVLPVTLDPLKKQGLDAPILEQFHHQPPAGIAAVPTERHFLTELTPGAENLAAWRQLPRFDRANLLSGVALRGRVLLESEGDRRVPLMVAGVYGGGRSLALAVNSTWRWPMQGHETQHRRFWRRAMLWLAGRDQLREDVWIDLAQRRFNPGANVVFTAGAKNSENEVVRDATMQAFVVGPDGNRRGLTLVARGDQYEGTIPRVAAPGDYQIEVTATRGDATLGTARAKFNVYEQDLELSNPSANPAFMEQLARLTESVGGRQLSPEELPAVLEEIRRAPPKSEIEVRSKWQPGDTQLDGWLSLLVLVGLLGTEWFLRKRWGMV